MFVNVNVHLNQIYLRGQQPPDGESVPLTARVTESLVEEGIR